MVKVGKAIHAKSNNKTLIIWLIVGAIVTLAVCALAIYFLSGQAAKDNATSKIESHLREKYGEEFKVENVTYTNSGLGVDGIWVSKAYPILD